jgi:hypothetical protein
MWLDAKTYWLTDRQSQCDFDFDLRAENRKNPSLFINKEEQRKKGKKTKVLTKNKYMAMGPRGARCQE